MRRARCDPGGRSRGAPARPSVAAGGPPVVRVAARRRRPDTAPGPGAARAGGVAPRRCDATRPRRPVRPSSSGGRLCVGLERLCGRAVEDDAACIDPEGPSGHALDGVHRVTDDEDGAGALDDLLDARLGAAGELGITGCERLVDEQDVGADRGRDAELQPRGHSGRVGAQRTVYGLTQPGEADDVVHLRDDVRLRDTEGGRADDDVASTGEVPLQGGPDSEQDRLRRGEHRTPLRREQSCERGHERALARTVAADDADCLAGHRRERDATQGVDLDVGAWSEPAGDEAPQRRPDVLVDAVRHVKVVDDDSRDLRRHCCTAPRSGGRTAGRR